MEYNLTVKYTLPYLAEVKKDKPHCIPFLSVIPISLLTTSVDIVTSLACRIFSLITLGTQTNVNKTALEIGCSSHFLLTIPYMCLFRAIRLLNDEDETFSWDRLFKKIFISIENEISDFSQSTSSFLERHVITRLGYTLLSLATLIASVGEAIIAAMFVPVAFLTAICDSQHPTCISINLLALRALMFTGVISDLGYYILKIINPKASEFKQEELTVMNFFQNLKKGNLLTANGAMFNLRTGQQL
jgi:hypothetical protein